MREAEDQERDQISEAEQQVEDDHQDVEVRLLGAPVAQVRAVTLAR